MTALAGQVLRLNGEPLANVRLEVERHVALTDRTGRFLVRLDGMGTGHCELWIDGRPASRPTASYGTYEVGLDIQAGRTTVLPYTIWMTKLEVTGFLNMDVYDRSSLAQLAADYFASSKWTVDLQASMNVGGGHSDFGSLPQRGSILFKLARYF